MYNDSVTVFCRYEDKGGAVTWYPHELENINFAIDRSAVIEKYGEQSQDNAILNVRYDVVDGIPTVGGVPWLPPKAWAGQEPESRAASLTFASGNNFGIILSGTWGSSEPEKDDEYGVNGFYDYLNRKYDDVFAITSVTKFDVIPHFEITGK